MSDRPPPYDEISASLTAPPFPGSSSSPGSSLTGPPCSAPPHYTENLPGADTKGVDWSLNTPNSSSYSDSVSSPAGPSAPPQQDVGPSTKGIDWSINRPALGPPHQPVYPGNQYSAHLHGNQPSPNRDVLRQTVVGTDPFTKWKDQFNRHYPDSKLSRDTPSIMRVEVPMNRAFPVLGHATCPDCFDGGPHQISTIKKKDGIISVKKIPCQKCRKCYKLLYFSHSAEVPVKEAPRVSRPPPYHNRPLPSQPTGNTHQPSGHGWSYDDVGHGWDPGDGAGHGWAD